MTGVRVISPLVVSAVVSPAPRRLPVATAPATTDPGRTACAGIT